MSDGQQQPQSSYRWVILIVMWLATFIGTFAQFQFAALAYRLIPALKLTTAQFASILSAPMLPAIFLSVAAGAAADRFGVKRVVTVGFVFAVAGIFLRITATGFWTMLIFMLMGGMASAFINANISKLMGTWFPPSQMGTAVGAYMSAGSAGMAIALATTAVRLERFVPRTDRRRNPVPP